MKNLKTFITVRNTIIAFVLFLNNAIWLTIAGEGLLKYSSLPKLNFMLHGYTMNDVAKLFNQYGAIGRNYYFWMNVLDIPFPVFLFLFGFLFFSITWHKWGFRYISCFLILASASFLIFDSVENVSVFYMLHAYPLLNPHLISISSCATQIKLYSLIIIYISIPITLIAIIIRIIFNKISGKQSNTTKTSHTNLH